MNALVVYFSLDGGTKFIAEKIAETLKADIVELKPRKKYREKEGFFKYFLGGMDVVFGAKPKLLNGVIDVDRYDTILIGTPVWAGSCAPPVRSFIARCKIRDKRIALFASSGGGEAGNCFAGLKQALPGNRFVGETAYVSAAKNQAAYADQIVGWAANLMADLSR